jgi:hypothetical protein
MTGKVCLPSRLSTSENGSVCHWHHLQQPMQLCVSIPQKQCWHSIPTITESILTKAMHSKQLCNCRTQVFAALACPPGPVAVYHACSLPCLNQLPLTIPHGCCSGSGANLDLVIGQPSGTSIVRMHHAQRLRLACPSGPDTVDTVLNYPRSKVAPGANLPQVPSVADAVWHVSAIHCSTWAGYVHDKLCVCTGAYSC